MHFFNNFYREHELICAWVSSVPSCFILCQGFSKVDDPSKCLVGRCSACNGSCGPCSPSVPDRRAQNCSWANSSCSNSSRRRRPDGEHAQPPALAEGKPNMALDRVQLGDRPNGPVQPGGSRPLDGLRWGRPTPATSSLATSGSSGPTSSGLLLKCRSLPRNSSPLHGSPRNLASSAPSQQSTTTIASLSCTRYPRGR
jgi:hypothetical protein